MTEQQPVVVLVHGAFAESASWNGVIDVLRARSLEVVAVANPLRGVAEDAAYVRAVIDGIGRPVVLAAHSYGGFVITEAAAGSELVKALVYVDAFAPDHDENAFDLSLKFPGSTLGDTLNAYAVPGGGPEFAIRPDVFHQQFCADVPAEQAALMAATQRPVTQKALTDALPTATPAWKELPSWFIFSDQDRNIPVAAHRFFAERAGAKDAREVAGASHALAVSQPGTVAESILLAVEAVG